MDVVLLSRIQFGLNISFHYIFPPLSIGLGLLLVLMEGAYLKTKNPIYETMAHFWVKIFALIFAIGVATGLVQIFGFGTNWAHFSYFVGDVFGSILGAEGIFAFFLESGFLAILLFGWNRVGPKMHFFSTLMVTFGAHFSALWIVIANSWMQTPAGHKIVGEGSARRAVIENFWDVLLNSSTLDRISHVLIAAWLTGAFLVLSVSAFYLLKRRHIDLATRSFKLSLLVAMICVLLQAISGDSTARGVAINQPIKLAAFEGVYTTEAPTPMWVVGVADNEKKEVKGIALPGFLSFLVFRNFKEAVPGLDQFSTDLWPKVNIVFQAYHGMIAMWFFMLLGVIMGAFAWKRKKILESRKTLRYLMLAVIFPEVANQLGWYAAEIGRQPWIVYSILRTQEGISPRIQANEVIFSLILFSLIYLLIFVLFIYLMDKKIREGPEVLEPEEYRDPYSQPLR